MFRRLLWKEAASALVVAVVLAALSYLRVYLEFPEEKRAAWTICVSLFVMTLMSAALGIGFSVLLDRLRMDPAAGAVPLLASTADILGIGLMVLFSYAIMRDPAGSGAHR